MNFGDEDCKSDEVNFIQSDTAAYVGVMRHARKLKAALSLYLVGTAIAAGLAFDAANACEVVKAKLEDEAHRLSVQSALRIKRNYERDVRHIASREAAGVTVADAVSLLADVPAEIRLTSFQADGRRLSIEGTGIEEAKVRAYVGRIQSAFESGVVSRIGAGDVGGTITFGVSGRLSSDGAVERDAGDGGRSAGRDSRDGDRGL